METEFNKGENKIKKLPEFILFHIDKGISQKPDFRIDFKTYFEKQNNLKNYYKFP